MDSETAVLKSASTTGKTNPRDIESAYNARFISLIEELNRLTVLANEAKTNLKREYYQKKIVKLRSKVSKVLLDKAIIDPSLLKKKETINE